MIFIKIVHINNIDTVGSRFNGHDMQIELNRIGITAKQFVVEKLGDDQNTIPLTKLYEEPFLRRRCMEIENNLSINAMVYPYGWRLLHHTDFKTCDVAHYHLINNHWLSITMLPELTGKKPSVLTVHDPWIFSGHCIYSLDCGKWKTGCYECPDLKLHFAIQQDKSNFMWTVKKRIFSQIDIDIVVASKYMMQLVLESPVTMHLPNVHLIPFGIDTDVFSPKRARSTVRQRLGIPQDNFVMFFRADQSPYKGFSIIKDMLDDFKPSRPVTLITVGMDDLLLKYVLKYKIKQFGWITDDELMADLYCACDVFLMPSTAEAFGMMAIEAMASGRPVIVMEGTSLPDVTFAPDCGICLSRDNAELELKEAVERLMKNPEECRARGEKGRELAEKHYRFNDYVNKHIKLYEEILSRGGARNEPGGKASETNGQQ